MHKIVVNCNIAWCLFLPQSGADIYPIYKEEKSDDENRLALYTKINGDSIYLVDASALEAPNNGDEPNNDEDNSIVGARKESMKTETTVYMWKVDTVQKPEITGFTLEQ